jgi:hypothetical protein
MIAPECQNLRALRISSAKVDVFQEVVLEVLVLAQLNFVSAGFGDFGGWHVLSHAILVFPRSSDF